MRQAGCIRCFFLGRNFVYGVHLTLKTKKIPETCKKTLE